MNYDLASAVNCELRTTHYVLRTMYHEPHHPFFRIFTLTISEHFRVCLCLGSILTNAYTSSFPVLSSLSMSLITEPVIQRSQLSCPRGLMVRLEKVSRRSSLPLNILSSPQSSMRSMNSSLASAALDSRVYSTVTSSLLVLAFSIAKRTFLGCAMTRIFVE